MPLISAKSVSILPGQLHYLSTGHDTERDFENEVEQLLHNRKSTEEFEFDDSPSDFWALDEKIGIGGKPETKVVSSGKGKSHILRCIHLNVCFDNFLTVISSSVNLINTIIGTQMLSMAYSFAKLGPGLGFLLLLLFAFVTRYSLRLLVIAAQRVPRHDTRNAHLTEPNSPSYATLCRAAFGPNVAPLVDFMMICACIGFAISYLVMLMDGMPRIIWELAPGWDGRGAWIVEVLSEGKFWLVASLLMIVPLSFSRDVDDFKWFSGTALACALYLAGVVMYCYFSGKGIGDVPTPGVSYGSRPWFIVTDEAIGVLPIFVFAFTCHQNIFSIYNELTMAERNVAVATHSDPDMTLKHILLITDISVAVCFIIYFIVALLGYLTFGTDSHVVLLNNYSSIPATTLARISFVLLSAFSYPIQLHPCRAALDSFIQHFQAAHVRSPMKAYTSLQSSFSSSLGSVTQPLPRQVQELATRRQLTTFLLVISYLCAAFIPPQTLDKILVFLGATCGSAVCYVLPGMIFRRVGTVEEGWEDFVAVAIQVIGVLCGALGVISCFMGA
ncbi:transmembrane amino acid transporter protein-domain-containing protein [Phlyctochytrium arcticum]|nr:transmembrane amino acid transporter protein-domain-containing protein [Phlyctochytrium arcticum]